MYQIKSESDKKNTLKWLSNFNKELEAIMKVDIPEEVKLAQANSFKSLIFQLEQQLEEYENLKKGNFKLPDEVTFSDSDCEDLVLVNVTSNVAVTDVGGRQVELSHA